MDGVRGPRPRLGCPQVPQRGRILICFHEPQLGGATRSVERIVPLLEEAGWQFSFWVPRPSELYDDLEARGWEVDGAPRVIEYGARAWRLPPGARARVRATPSYLRRYREFLEQRRPALVHANSILTLAEALLARRLGIPALVHVHEMLTDNMRSRLFRGAAWRRLNAIIAVSQPSARRLTWHGHRPRIIYEGAPVPNQPVDLRPDPRPFRVGTVAVISTRKGSDLFVEAARLVGARNGAFRFEMVGVPHEIEQRWGQQVINAAGAVGVEHLPRADVFERFRNYDAFVLPSRSDPFPIVMLEAMASGLPVIGARRDGIAEQIVPGTGMLIDPEDPRALADAIAWVSAQPVEVRRAMGLAARRRVSTHFTVDRQAEAMHDAYRSILSGGS
jgi:glycosyltransferase involved in cell wall biosynthesis